MADEARAMLDALMGADRDAPIAPPANQSSKNHNQNSSNYNYNGNIHHHPSKRKRSCFDRDICPYYCAWGDGIDLFELFVNTKSDIGPNEFICDDDAAAEFQGLPSAQKERLGYERMLHRKLRDLVRQADRIVMRNKEKLRMEVARNSSKNSGNRSDPVLSIRDDDVDKVAEMMAQLEIMEKEIRELVKKLEDLDEKESLGEDAVQDKNGDEKEGDAKDTDKDKEDDNEKEETQDGKSVIKEEAENKETTEIKEDSKEETDEKAAESSSDSATGNAVFVIDTTGEQPTPNNGMNSQTQPQQQPPQNHDEKVALIELITTKILDIEPLRDQITKAKRDLYYFRGDTTTDKTVCEISGNFMSSRDADERIAAHYAGKQYVGWKAVRDRCKELDKKFGMRGDRGGGLMQPLLPHERELYKRDLDAMKQGSKGGREDDRKRRSRSPSWDRHRRGHGPGYRGDHGHHGSYGYHGGGGHGGGYGGGGYHGGGGYDDYHRHGGGGRYRDRERDRSGRRRR
mmetsp:Transcript_48756/g.72417  ORF Transcript_48756/g.72417 Transcript_48756/m.72417 type:complete len:513 (-) Transcript_48756:551-2089(-)